MLQLAKRMATRHEDWLRQAKRDLEQAQHATQGGFHEWACFASQQAAEKAVKALYQKLGAEAWGHSVAAMLAELPEEVAASSQLLDRAKSLDRHYISPRYPNSVPQGTPADYYTGNDAGQAVQDAQAVITFCEDHILR